ncbi:hypothetical protein ACFV1U_01945, partial [Streptomyces microflavus]
MPRDSAVTRDRDGEAADWSVSDYLLAAVVDHLAGRAARLAGANTPNETHPPAPPGPEGRPRPAA